jgi:precorrin-6B methylase 2
MDTDLSRVELVGGKLTVQAATTEEGARLIASARKAYAAQTIKDAAKRFGWRVAADTKTTTGQTQLKLTR